MGRYSSAAPEAQISEPTKDARNEHRQLHQHTTNPVSKDHAQRTPLRLRYPLGNNRTYTPLTNQTVSPSQCQQSTPSFPCLSICSFEAEHTHQPTITQRLLSESSHTHSCFEQNLPFRFPSQRHLHFTPNAITTHYEPTYYNTIRYNTPIILEKNKKPWKSIEEAGHLSH